MKLECFLYPGWRRRIRAASRRRAWMDDTPERCLALAIANALGWEIGNAAGFAARWNGDKGVVDVESWLDDPAQSAVEAPVSLFRQGRLTFHVPGLFRAEPSWSLWFGGLPNVAKDGIAPLAGIIATDWSPYSFTMNWRFIRSNQWVRFEPDEAFAFFPVERGAIEDTIPRFHTIDEAPNLKPMFERRSESRDAIHKRMRAAPLRHPSDKWQKLYYRGVCAAGHTSVAYHRTNIRLREFRGQPI